MKGKNAEEHPPEITSVKTTEGTLHTAAEVARHFSAPAELLLRLADAGFAPHYRLEGFTQPLFRLADIKEWIGNNLLRRCNGKRLPPPEVKIIGDQPELVLNPPPRSDLTGGFCTSGSEREFTQEDRWRCRLRNTSQSRS